MIAVEPRVVEASRGWEWWPEGWRIFTASPGTWIGIMVVYVVASVLVSVVPYVGDLGQSLLTPVFLGGMMVGCRAVDRGEPLRISHLFEGFQGAHFVPLVVIGAVNVALVLALKLVGGNGLMGNMALDKLSAATDPMAGLAGSALAMSATALVVLLLVLVVGTVFAMLNWFAPALVTLRGVRAVEAMKLSFVACLRNWVPFLVYGIIVVVAGVVLTTAMIVLALVLGAGGVIATHSLQQGITAFIGFFVVMAIVATVIAAVVGPVAVGSVYAGFKDTLDDPDATVTSPQYR
jgi:hypothetical protein